MRFILDGYCGSYCGACPDLLATRAGTAENRCGGCKSDVVHPGWCSICHLKSCAREKKIDWCYQCEEYPCKKITAFFEDPEYPYHREAADYQQMIKTQGKAIWLEKMKKRWSCGKCGTAAAWWDLTCEECGEPFNGYPKP
jgi:hypothetical protein